MQAQHAKLLTLCVVYDNDRILLGMKKRGFGMGRWNGFGGKVEEGEIIQEAAARELLEEACIQPHLLQKRGVLYFIFAEGSIPPLEVHVFSANTFIGNPTESDEMRPEWFLHKDIPYHEMWPDDQHWLPLVLAGKNIEGTFHFKDAATLISHEIKTI
ncbi:MAG: 8-oxo-dGTP diphosphatase [Patescibacteria group bacterium]